jgi:hypothetical protein
MFYFIVTFEYFSILSGLQRWKINGIHFWVHVEQQPLHQCAEIREIWSSDDLSRRYEGSNGQMIDVSFGQPRM